MEKYIFKEFTRDSLGKNTWDLKLPLTHDPWGGDIPTSNAAPFTSDWLLSSSIISERRNEIYCIKQSYIDPTVHGPLEQMLTFSKRSH
jgi:hypothetical protein